MDGVVTVWVVAGIDQYTIPGDPSTISLIYSVKRGPALIFTAVGQVSFMGHLVYPQLPYLAGLRLPFASCHQHDL